MTSYVRLHWHHDSAEDPVLFLSELDADRYEIRRVQAHRDGQLDWADAHRETPTIGLGQAPVPDLAELNAQTEFHAEPITATDFETAWTRARYGR
ncbi:DUF6881 domain-containing protein [Streptomyces sp. NPDC058157]|uniref:DUF6881 domain-containing protein n=1 Tax=Streptomyces sp. NPDC058157 TaxID=3346360 RepID=UPI0036EE4035